MFFLFFGKAAMTFLNINIVSLSVAGGIILFVIALGMILVTLAVQMILEGVKKFLSNQISCPPISFYLPLPPAWAAKKPP